MKCIPAALLLFCLAGCDMGDMYDQAHYEPFEPSPLFENDSSARPLVAGTVARGQLHEDAAFYTGKQGAQYVTELPVKLEMKLLERGRERFNIYCSVCHGISGYGNGMIVQRGFRKPPSFHDERLRNAPLGHYFDVITNGFGAMPTYNLQVEPRDRWAIAAYIRALQLSQRAPFDDLAQPDQLHMGVAQ